LVFRLRPRQATLSRQVNPFCRPLVRPISPSFSRLDTDSGLGLSPRGGGRSHPFLRCGLLAVLMSRPEKSSQFPGFAAGQLLRGGSLSSKKFVFFSHSKESLRVVSLLASHGLWSFGQSKYTLPKRGNVDCGDSPPAFYPRPVKKDLFFSLGRTKARRWEKR